MMNVIAAGDVLAVTLWAGILVYESAHSAVLHAFGIRYDVYWDPDRRAAGTDLAMASPLATVAPRPVSPDAVSEPSDWRPLPRSPWRRRFRSS